MGENTSSTSTSPAKLVASSPLKPLDELSEADIMQLTREDCRRYLKERGMRRPSWNKAEAIQQVLLLKGLFGSPSNRVVQDDSTTASPNHQEQTKQFLDRCKSVMPSGGFGSPFPVPQTRQQCAFPDAPLRPGNAQLTIFYSGIVNVFEDVSLETAQAIMLLAATKSPNALDLNAQAGHHRHVFTPSDEQHKRKQQEDSTESCLPQARTASLQRFLAKRRERIINGNPHKRSSNSDKVALKKRKPHQRKPRDVSSSDNSSCSEAPFPGVYFGSNAGGASLAPALLPEQAMVPAM